MKGQPEAEGPSEEGAIQGVAKKTLEGKQQTEGLTNKQMKERETDRQTETQAYRETIERER